MGITNRHELRCVARLGAVLRRREALVLPGCDRARRKPAEPHAPGLPPARPHRGLPRVGVTEPGEEDRVRRERDGPGADLADDRAARDGQVRPGGGQVRPGVRDVVRRGRVQDAAGDRGRPALGRRDGPADHAGEHEGRACLGADEHARLAGMQGQRGTGVIVGQQAVAGDERAVADLDRAGRAADGELPGQPDAAEQQLPAGRGRASLGNGRWQAGDLDVPGDRNQGVVEWRRDDRKTAARRNLDRVRPGHALGPRCEPGQRDDPRRAGRGRIRAGAGGVGVPARDRARQRWVVGRPDGRGESGTGRDRALQRGGPVIRPAADRRGEAIAVGDQERGRHGNVGGELDPAQFRVDGDHPGGHRAPGIGGAGNGRAASGG